MKILMVISIVDVRQIILVDLIPAAMLIVREVNSPHVTITVLRWCVRMDQRVTCIVGSARNVYTIGTAKMRHGRIVIITSVSSARTPMTATFVPGDVVTTAFVKEKSIVQSLERNVDTSTIRATNVRITMGVPHFPQEKNVTRPRVCAWSASQTPSAFPIVLVLLGHVIRKDFAQ